MADGEATFVEKVEDVDVYLDVQKGLFRATINGKVSLSKNLKDLEARIRKAEPIVDALEISVPTRDRGNAYGNRKPRPARKVKVRGVHRNGNFIGEDGTQLVYRTLAEYSPEAEARFRALADEWQRVEDEFADRYLALVDDVLGYDAKIMTGWGDGQYTKKLTQERLKEIQATMKVGGDEDGDERAGG